MKALTVKQPWINLILSGKKTIEVRKWSTNYRGELLLTCSKNPKHKLSGKAVAIINLFSVSKMTLKDAPNACYPYKKELYAWRIHLKKTINPFNVKGKLGIFDINI